MDLAFVWFILLAVLWTGYFVLEGFDFGVGVLLKPLAKNEKERRVMINTIGPVWDGNEVWLLTAGGATFAAFPEWYATMFSGFYLPLLVILLALILRGVAFEYRHKRSDGNWQRNWERCIIIGSFVPALLWGVAFANLVQGVPIGADRNFTGSVLDLLSPYTLLGGLLTLGVFVTHGAVFLSLKTLGDLRHRARTFAVRTGLVTAVIAVAFIVWTAVAYSSTVWTWIVGGIVAVAFLAGLAAVARGREGWAFLFDSVAIAAFVAMLFVTLFPNVMVSSLNPEWNLTIANASATPYTLQIMSIAALVMTPVVIAYQAWTYWVFQRRLGTQHMPATDH
ncbi:cytochrome d ubiquinol oxidase subunit II [Naumannella halotolerans]|uniref:cytochrome d ubiquinol oxidase subunit II n=1 Tax=Naumannella halotolerans TaxID=993414 RepID=UPI00370D2607